MSEKIKISNVQNRVAGYMIATCDVHIVPWKLTLKNCGIFQKGEKRWVSMPSKQYDKDGVIHYAEVMKWDDDETRQRFRSEVTKALDVYMDSGQHLEPEPLIKDDDIPF